jgi:pyrophosphatase PpaX
VVYRGILFDLDGTLIDTNRLITESFRHTIRTHYDREPDMEIVRAYYGKTLRAALEVLGPDKVDELIQTYREYNLQHHDRLARSFAGVAEVVRELYNHGLLLGIVTSKTHSIALRGLRLFDMDKYFAVIIGAEQCRNHKPHPEPVLLALAGLGLPAGDCLMIGDSPADLASGKAAGVKTAAVAWSEIAPEILLAENPDYVLDTIADLLPMCGIKKE